MGKAELTIPKDQTYHPDSNIKDIFASAFAHKRVRQQKHNHQHVRSDSDPGPTRTQDTNHPTQYKATAKQPSTLGPQKISAAATPLITIMNPEVRERTDRALVPCSTPFPKTRAPGTKTPHTVPNQQHCPEDIIRPAAAQTAACPLSA